MKLDRRREALLRRTFVDFWQMEAFIEQPLILERAKGTYYWDIEGRRYFDAVGGIFVASLGHGHPAVLEAMRRQMDRMTFAPPLHGIADITLDFVERLGAVTPPGLTFVKGFSGGSEAVEAAIKFVRQYFKQTGHESKYKFVSRYHGYHGSTGAAMSASGTGPRKTKFEPQMAGFLKVFPPTHYRPYFSSWEECNRYAAQTVEDVIVHEDPETVAGVILEPIGNTGGIITPTPEYFQKIREVCDRYNVMLIFDEVITGFGKTGSMFASQAFGVTPDLICCGKGISNGAIPLGAMIARQTMAEAFLGTPESNRQFAHGNTFAGNPLASAVGIAVLDTIEREGLCERAKILGDRIVERLNGLRQYGVVREIRGQGVLRGVEFIKNGHPGEPFPELGIALKRTAIENGLVLRVDPNWFAVSPALVSSESEIDEMGGLIEKSLQHALKEVLAVDSLR
jgi:adenosylmethionine-8-amino-7-oxononanoate aminotransferase